MVILVGLMFLTSEVPLNRLKEDGVPPSDLSDVFPA